MTKITFIGAGSLGVTRGLVRDVLTFPLLRHVQALAGALRRAGRIHAVASTTIDALACACTYVHKNRRLLVCDGSARLDQAERAQHEEDHNDQQDQADDAIGSTATTHRVSLPRG